MLAKESVRARLNERAAGDQLHRVRLHAPAGLRLPPAPPGPGLPPPTRGQRPVGQHHGRHRPDQADDGGQRLRPHVPAHHPGGRYQVRQDRGGDQHLAGPGPDQPLRAVPVPHPLRGRHGRHLPASADVPRQPEAGDRRAIGRRHRHRSGSRRAQRALAHDVVTLVHGEAEARAGGEQASAGAVHRGDPGISPRAPWSPCWPTPSSTSLFAAPGLRSRAPGRVGPAGATTGLSSSRNEARRTIEGGGAHVNNRKVDGADATLAPEDLLFGRYLILRRGKTTQHLVQVT